MKFKVIQLMYHCEKLSSDSFRRKFHLESEGTESTPGPGHTDLGVTATYIW